MARFECGVKGYITGECTIQVHFPVDFRDRAELACKHCPYLSSNERICQLNKQPVAFPHSYVGACCPLEIKEEEF